MIKIENLSKVFTGRQNEVNALNGISVHIEKGDIFGIIGMSGAGKSTLLRCLCALEQPTGGSIEVDGIKLDKKDARGLKKIRKNMGVVFQGYNLLMQKTVWENVAFPLQIAKADKAQINAQVEKLLSLVELSDKAGAYPSQLSGGQKQRVAIARALATQPDILLCDEPTSALDPKTTKRMLALLEDINKNLGVTIVIITHEISLVRKICNRVAVISRGKIAESGYVADVFQNPKTEITKLLLDWQV